MAETKKTAPVVDMEAIQAEVAKIIEAAKAEAAEIINAAKAHKTAAQIAEEERVAKINAEMEEYVEVKLFKDNNKYKDDVFVSCNGENCVIKRGERVKIKRKFAEILDNSEHQDYETALLIEQATQVKKIADM